MPAKDTSTVAVVDDDEAVRDSTRFLLEVEGYSVATFASAIEFLKAEVGRFLCLLLDQHMPQMTGLELVEQLRSNGIAIPTMLMTGLPSRAIVARADALGIERVLEKPLVSWFRSPLHSCGT